MRIAVYGASGFTGSLVVAEARRRGIEPVLVGRDIRRLRRAAEEAGVPNAEVCAAGLGETREMAVVFAECDAVVNCAGPFTRWGEPVVRAAISAGRHYVDTAGEQRHIHRMLGEFDSAAKESAMTIVPGVTDDGVPGDLIAHLAAARVSIVRDVLIADLRAPGGVSRGTARSMLAVVGGTGLEYAAGGWHPDSGEEFDPITPPGQTRLASLRAFALPGVVTIPRHVAAERVRGAIRTEVATLFTGLTEEVAETIPEVVPMQARQAGQWLMFAGMTGGHGERIHGWVTGPDAYGLTAVIAVETARRLVEVGAPAGALTPAQAVDPADFLEFLTSAGARWQVGQD
ncbi:saccharopine dehydrogenase NADP-binding domain-containing protein [Nocardia sp. CA2R105]|uniref:saccharopine dehydrogenase family protein n=1 Tax=Nocardia coffeae TaxID=2873381 RepID=UPI001CA70DC7|nr:saccharopine dehydrogenase NADP-binding domain-containing protein [Nocardia coffeae]MBY8862683.1 saccharopine dehydrogenase NADP-binding domain-containing protein [Nocardia coffeae]